MNIMSDSTEPVAPAETTESVPAKKGLSPATIIALILIAIAAGFGGYIGVAWNTHNARVSKLKARMGDYVQLRIEEEVEETPAPAGRGRGPGRGQNGEGSEGGNNEAGSGEGSGNGDAGGGGEGGRRRRGGAPEAPKKPAKPKPNAFEKWLAQMLPAPVQVVYWRDPKLSKDDVTFLAEFKDVEIMSVTCEKIDEAMIAQLLTLPNIQRLRITASDLSTETIGKWKIPESLARLTLVNPTWKEKEMDAVGDAASENKGLEGKISITNQIGPSFGGA